MVSDNRDRVGNERTGFILSQILKLPLLQLANRLNLSYFSPSFIPRDRSLVVQKSPKKLVGWSYCDLPGGVKLGDFSKLNPTIYQLLLLS
jgi:hypothetical protein